MNKELLHKYFQGIASAEEENNLLDWVEKTEENHDIFLQERRLFDIALFSGKVVAKKKKNFFNQILK